MKKSLMLIAAVLMLSQASFAACGPCNVNPAGQPCQKCKQHDITKCECEKPKCETPCEKKAYEDSIKKDNKCFFDNQFNEMKKVLCLSPQQESAIDCIYDKYKNQMQIFHDQAECRARKLCQMLNEDCIDNDAVKEQKDELKEIRDEAKEQYKCFEKEIKAELCKDQVKCLNKYNKAEKKKMKKFAKYCLVPHFPCDCGCKMHRACGCD